MQRTKTIEHYNQIANQKDQEFADRLDPNILEKDPLLTKDVEKFFRTLFTEKRRRMIDFGCGTGWYLPILKEYAESISGVDVAEDFLGLARELTDKQGVTNIDFKIYDGITLPYQDTSTDCVFEWDVMHHVDDVPQMISEIHRVLEPGGVFVGIEPNTLNMLMTIYHAKRPHERGALSTNRITFAKALRKKFSNVQILSNNLAISYNNAAYRKIISAVNPLFTKAPFFKEFSLRYIFIATK